MIGNIAEKADQIVGRPYQSPARGPHAFSCLGVYLHLLEHAGGIRIEDPYAQESLAAVRRFWSLHRELDAGEDVHPLDVLLSATGDAGVACLWTAQDDRCALTAVHGLGVTREAIAPLWGRFGDLRAFRLLELEGAPR